MKAMTGAFKYANRYGYPDSGLVDAIATLHGVVWRTCSSAPGMRLGYAIAPKAIVEQMRPFSTGTVSVLVKYGGVATLKDTDSQAAVKKITISRCAPARPPS